MKLRSAAMLKTMRNALLREQVDQKRNMPVVKKKLGQVSQQSKKKKIASRKAAKNARRYVKPVLSSHSKRRLNLFLRPIIARCRSKVLQNAPSGSILQYLRSSLSHHSSLRSFFCLFLSGRLRQVLLYVYLGSIFLWLFHGINQYWAMCGSRGGGWGQGVRPPLKITKIWGFLAILVRIPSKTTQLTSQYSV